MTDDLDDFFEQYLKNDPTFKKKYESFKTAYNDIEASINHGLYLKEIDETIPIREINIMVERMNDISKYRISKYGMYRDSEDYLVKTEWFFNLSENKQNKIRFDFYNNIVLGIHGVLFRA
ncbi:hypothetical protein A9Q87_13355 [Flavobacteriales bacterium 34_180_T64]|nr:hypothetical protein A9Q87_13355 [Flavobacteriales bacterium 34_180_T64]